MSYVIPNSQAHFSLPSIHSLDLDLPVPKYQYPASSSPTHVSKPHQLPSPPSMQYASGLPVIQPSFPHYTQTQPVPQIHLVNIPTPQQQQPQHIPQQYPQQHGQHLPFASPISSPSFKVDGLSTLCAVASSRNRSSSDPAHFAAQQHVSTPVSPVSATTFDKKALTPVSILNSANEEESGTSSASGSDHEHEHDHDHDHDDEGNSGSSLNSALKPLSKSALASSPSGVSKPSWKPRKKRQCPECKLFFSNLATHKSTHLKPTSRPHVCEFCNRGFARPNDLFRHVKCHWKETGSDKGQFKCPFKSNVSGDHCCHSTGIFSRCDTFKNHLKAIHFQYPSGTKKDQRNKVAGTCRACHQHFSNVDDWVSNHVEKNLCPYAGEIVKN